MVLLSVRYCVVEIYITAGSTLVFQTNTLFLGDNSAGL